MRGFSMLYPLFLLIFLFQNYSFSWLTREDHSQVDVRIAQDRINEIYKPLQEIKGSRLLAGNETTSGQVSRFEIPRHTKEAMRVRCSRNLLNLEHQVANYNKFQDSYDSARLSRIYNTENSTTHRTQDNPRENHEGTLKNFVGQIKGSVAGCVEEIRNSYIDLSRDFVVPFMNAYKRNQFFSFGINYMDSEIIAFMRVHFQGRTKLSTLREKFLLYDEFQERCIFGRGSHGSMLGGVNALFNEFYDIQGFSDDATRSLTGSGELQTAFNRLSLFFSSDNDWCRIKKQELQAFSQTELFKEFVSLPARCAGSDSCSRTGRLRPKPRPARCAGSDPQIETLKRAVLVNEETSSNDVDSSHMMNYCRQEYEKAVNLCSCGRQNCREAEEGASFFSQIDGGEFCNNDGADDLRRFCLNSVNNCRNRCNESLSHFKRAYLDSFFVREMPVGVPNIHSHLGTPCVDSMLRILHGYRQSVLSKVPYSGFSEISSSTLASVNDLGLVCRDPLESLDHSLSRLDEICEENQDSTEDDDTEDDDAENDDRQNREGQTQQRLLSHSDSYQRGSGRGSSYGGSSRSASEEFSYEATNHKGLNRSLSSFGSGAFQEPKGYGSNNHGSDNQRVYQFQGEDSVRTFVGKRASSQADLERGTESSSSQTEETALQGETFKGGTPSQTGAGFASSSSGFLSVPSRIWSATRDKMTDLGQATDGRIRDHLLQDGTFYTSQSGYSNMTKGEREAPSGIAGIAQKTRQGAYRAYNRMNPISREDLRRRMGFMRSNVDLFEVNDALFCRICLTLSQNSEERGNCEMPRRSCDSLENEIAKLNEWSEYQLERPNEARVMVEQRLERERQQREIANQGLTRDEQLTNINKSLQKTEEQAKKYRANQGMTF